LRIWLPPADYYDAFVTLHHDHDMSVEDIAVRFGVTPGVVRWRLKLAAVGSKLFELCCVGGLALDQLSAFAMADDHALQEKGAGRTPLE
jgi:ParB family chromosome partitioning protein